jgi:hypothetical protein
MVEKRFTSLMIGGITECRWDGCVVATIRLSLFPELHELDGFDISYKKQLRDAVAGRIPRLVALFDTEQDAVDAVRHACIVGWVRPQTEEPDRPILRPRDEHIKIEN